MVLVGFVDLVVVLFGRAFLGLDLEIKINKFAFFFEIRKFKTNNDHALFENRF